MTSATTKITWTSFILKDLDIPLQQPPQLFCDNLSVLYMSVNLVFHACTKHIETDYRFVREKVVIGSLITPYIPSPPQVVDILTKPLSKTLFKILRSTLGVHANAHSDLTKDEREDTALLATSQLPDCKLFLNQDQNWSLLIFFREFQLISLIPNQPQLALSLREQI